MTPRLLSSLRAWVREWLRRGAANSPAAQPDCDVLLHPSVTDYTPGTAAPSFGALFCAAPHRSAMQPERLDAAIRERAHAFAATQPDYQPVYGFETEFPAKRSQHLERNVTIVQTLLKHIVPKHQPRILDVGCNMGYVALRLAETYPNVVGLEISPQHLKLCRLLAARSNSPARFFSDNALELLQSGEDDLENVDVVLLYNVVHQFIFHQGLQSTRALLARLASRVDTVIVELALKQDYVKHGKDHLLPEDPAEVLADCSDVEITLLNEKPRPVYRIRRRSARFGPIEIRPARIDYSLNPNPLVSRKYYAAEDRFLKLYRFSRPGERTMFDREVGALLKLRDTDVAPRLIDWTANAASGAILMSLVKGDRVVVRVYQANRPLQPHESWLLTQEYLRVAKAVHDAVGYQNDLQAHNLIWTPAGRLVLVDYEQAAPDPTNDPFGLLLWSVFEFWGGRDKQRPVAIRSLRLIDATPPVPILPDFSGLRLPAEVAELVAQAARGGDWGAFVTAWSGRLSAPRTTAAAPGSA